MTRSRLKKFYALMKPRANGVILYAWIEAELHQDARIYADHFYGDAVDEVISAGQFWDRKNNSKTKTYVALTGSANICTQVIELENKNVQRAA